MTTPSCSTRFTLAAVLAVLGAFAPPLQAQDDGRIQYYLRGSDAANKTSMTSGGNSAVGWATSLGGAIAKNGVDNASAVYHVPLTYMLRTATSGNQTFGGYRLVFEGTTPSLMLKTANATLTIGRLLVVSGTQADILAGEENRTYTLAGSDWQVEEGAVLGLGASIDTNDRNIICASTISGNGTVAAIGNGAYNGTVTLSGDLSGFTGRLHAAMPRLATIAGPYGAANMKPASHTLVIGAASAFPTATPYGDIVADAVTVPDGATLRFSCDVTSPANRGWDLGSGAAPTICVDAGHTVTVLGPVSGSAGFNKTGDGTLVLNVGGAGAYDTITITGAGTVSAERLAQYAAACTEWQSDLPLEVSAPAVTSNDGNALTISSRVHNLPAGASATLSFAYGDAPDALTFTNVVSAPITASPSSASTTITRLVPGKVYYVQSVLVTDGEPPTVAVSSVSTIPTSPVNELPAGYAPIEYIEGLGTQYIDTGYNPTPTLRTILDFQFRASVNQQRVFGTEGDVTGNLVYSMYRNGSGQWAYARQDNKGNWQGLSVATDTSRHLIDFNFLNASGKRAVTVSGTTINYAITQAATQTALYTMYLGASHATSGPSNISKHRIYSCQMYEGDAPVRDFVPARRKSDGVIGLYDRVCGVFHPSASATGYSAGPEVFAAPAAPTPISAAEVIANGAIASISLDFAASDSSRDLRVVYGPSNAGANPADWFATAAVATVAAGETTYSFTPPAEWGDDNHLVLRFYFDDVLPRWSNAIYWQDYSAPAVTDVALDGTGGDTIVVSGTLASFPGDSCALSVYAGDSPTTLTNAWTGLAGGVRDATGAFTLTLHEPDTSAARFIAPDGTYYVTVQAVADGKVTRTEPVAVTTKAAPTFAAAPTAAVNRRTVTFTGRLSDLGMTGGTAVRLYVGAPGDTEDDLLAVESPVAVTDTATSFSITHTFADFEVAHPWQLRAVATSTNGAATAETRSALASVTTKDTTAYTWKSSVTAGDWSDAANWTDNQNGDCLGYPASANATVTFPADTAATVRFTEALTVGAITIAGNGSVTFTQGGESAAATKLTAASILLQTGTDLGKCVTLDGVSVQSSGDVTFYEYRSMSLVNGAHLYGGAGFTCQLTNDVRVVEGSMLDINNLSFSGGTLTISNATVQVRNFAYVGNLRPGGHLVFQGTSPKLYCSYNSGCFYAAKTAIAIDFLVPAGGYEAAPIQGPATADYSFANNKGSAGAYSYTVNVLDESPANFVDASVTTPLIQWTRASNKGGINKSAANARVLEGRLPAYGVGAVTDDAFAWSDTTDYPSTLLVTINGSSNSGKLQVSATPDSYGAADVSPAYGYTAVAAGAEQECAAPEIVPLAEGTHAFCTGWKLYAVDPATLARAVIDSGADATYTFTGTAGWRELEWQFEIQHLVTAAAQGPGTAAPASQWIAEGATATVTATPNANSVFHSWAESVLGGEYTDNPLTVAVNTNYAFTARFGGDYYVSTQGSDQNDGLTPATALLTVGEAVERANRTYGSRITVLPGTYPFPGTQEWTTLTNAVTLASQTGNPDDVVIDCCGGYGLSTEHESARIEGVRIANSYGGAANGHALWINGGSATNIIVCNLTGMQYAAVRVTGGELAGLLFTNNVNSTKSAANGGVVLDGAGSRLVASTFIRNKAGAAPVYIPASSCHVEDCDFFTNLYVNGYSNGQGGAIYSTPKGTAIRRCRFIGNAGYETGACFMNNGGSFSDCLFQGNEAFYHGSCIRCWYDNLTVDRCAFTGNIGNDTGIVNAPSGTTSFRNCLFADNRSKGGAPGGVNSGNTVHLQNCTFYGNRSTTGSIHAANLSKAASTIKNCVFYNNGPAADSRNVNIATAANIQNTCYPEAVEGNTTGNFAANPLFVDAENGDFHLQYGSTCIDAGQELLADDLDGDERPQDGNADGEAVSDLGCYEMPPNSNPITATLSVTEAGAIAPADAALSVFVSGANLEGLAFTWRAIRDADGALTTNVQTSAAMATADTAVFSFTGLEPGLWRFEVTVENGAGDKATSAAEGSYVVGPDTCYVAPDGGHVWPYDTQAGAATNFASALDLGPRTIRVAPGNYPATMPRMTDATLNADWIAAIETPTAVIGPDDPATAIVNCGRGLGLFLGNAGASVSGLTIAGAGGDTEGSSLRVNAGSVSNVVVRQTGAALPIRLAAGTLFADSVVSNAVGSWCTTVVAAYGATMRGVTVRNCSGYKYCAVSLLGATARMENCAVINNNCHEMGGIRIGSDAILTDCVISNNTGGGSNEYQGSGGIHLNGGSARLIRCLVAGNTGNRSGAIGLVGSGALYATNCLFAANTGNNYAGGVQVLGDRTFKIVNCTFAGNKSNKTGGWYMNTSSSSGLIANCIFADNTVAGVEKDLFLEAGVTAPVFSHTRYTEAVAGNADGNTAADPQLKADWTLGSASPCIGAGDWTFLGATKAEVKAQKDLAGNSRLFGGQVDMGCFEARVAATMILLQ